MRWRGFCADLLAYAHELGVETIVTLGALLADSPHTRPVPVTGNHVDEGMARSLGLEQSRYEGPTGIVGVFQDACRAPGSRRCRSGRRCRTTSRSRRAPRRPGAAAPTRGSRSTSRFRWATCRRRRAPGSAVDELAAQDAEMASTCAPWRSAKASRSSRGERRGPSPGSSRSSCASRATRRAEFRSGSPGRHAAFP